MEDAPMLVDLIRLTAADGNGVGRRVLCAGAKRDAGWPD